MFNTTCRFGYDHAAQRCPLQDVHDELEQLQSKLDALTKSYAGLDEWSRKTCDGLVADRDAALSRLHSAIEQIEALKRIMKGIGIVGPEHAWRQLQAVLTEKPESFAGLPEHLQGFAGLPDEHQPKTVVERQEIK